MDEYERETTDYEPNFTMKDPEEAKANETAPVSEPIITPAYANATEPASPAAEPAPQPPASTGLYRDPRSDFRQERKFYNYSHEFDGSSASWDNGRGNPPKSKKERQPSKPVTFTRKSLALLIVGCLVISCLFGLGGVGLGHSIWAGDNSPSPAALDAPDTDAAESANADQDKEEETNTTGYDLHNATGSNLTVQQITNRVQRSVVEIRTESVARDTWMQQYVTQGAGSGVIIAKNGFIMTNNHVIEGAGKITVTTSDQQSYEAELIGTDATNDVAVIKIEATGLTPVIYGNSDQLNVGDLAVAIGNPLGELGGTVTAGIISAKDRELQIDGKTMKLLQTDSSINPGNSGGGLFNGDGQLVGLVVAKSSGSDVEGLGFAIPINTAAKVAKDLREKGYVTDQPCTGMTYTEGNSGFGSFFGDGGYTAVYIYSVDSKDAEKAGFQSGDLVFAVDGTQITSFDDLSGIVSAHKVGDVLTFTIVRDGKTKDIKLALQEKKGEKKKNTAEPQKQQ